MHGSGRCRCCSGVDGVDFGGLGFHQLHDVLQHLLAFDHVIADARQEHGVTAIAAALQRPALFAGYHFFNPVPLMKVVEVIAGLKTKPDPLS